MTDRRNEILTGLVLTRMNEIEARAAKLRAEPRPVLSGTWFDAMMPDIDAEIEAEYGHWMELAEILYSLDPRLGVQTRADFERLTA